MKRLLAIADDLTGAAEIAGIGHRYALPTMLALNRPDSFCDGLTVIDSDTRSLNPALAQERIVQLINGIDSSQFDLIYKKTDSVMRGRILIEVVAMMEQFGRPNALLLPQNPSRGRTIVDGEYRIDGVPLHQTSFAEDPDHPATTSDAAALLGKSERYPISVLKSAANVDLHGLTLACAASSHEVRYWADRI